MNDMMNTIKNRLSSRYSFDVHRPISPDDLHQILEAARWAPTAHNMQNFEIMVVDDKILLKKLADLKAPILEDFIKENYRQLSFSVEELKRKKVGILGTGFPPYMRDLSIKPSPKDKISSSQGSLVKKNPVLLIVIYDPGKRAPASKGDKLGYMSIGCVMENMWLMAYSLGISFHIVSSFNDGSIETKAKRILGIPRNLKIAFTCRIGYMSKPEDYFRVRRDIKDFTSYNQYGNKQ